MTSCILSKCGLFSTVDNHVCFQSASTTKQLLAFWANLHLFSAMGEHMLIQVSSRTKWLLALNTIKYPFPVVGLHMPLQNFWSTKWLLASCTIVYFLSSVGGVAFFWCWLVTISVNWVDSSSRTCRHCTKTLWSLIYCIFPLSFCSLFMVRCITLYRVFPICPITSYNNSFL